MASKVDMKMALNAEIVAQGHSEDAMSRVAAAPLKHTHRRHVVNASVNEWSMGGDTGPGASFQDTWPEHLPRPPSMRKLTGNDADCSENSSGAEAKGGPSVIIFNANTQEGSSLVRSFSQKGLNVIAVVRVIASRNTKKLAKMRGVTVRVADLNNKDAVVAAAQGCQQAFLVTKYWERFENSIEECMAKVVITASAEVGIKRFFLATFEDTHELRLRGRKSQLVPTVDGLVYPKFEGMDSISKIAAKLGVQITHMFTSFLEDETGKKSLVLIRRGNGKIIAQSNIEEKK